MSKDQSLDESAAEPEADHGPDPEHTGSRRFAGMLPALAALMVSIVAIGLSISLWLAEDADDDIDYVTIESLERHDVRIEAVERTAESLGGELEEINARLETLDTGVAEIRSQLGETTGDLDAFDSRLEQFGARLDQAVQRLDEIAGEKRELDRAVERRLHLLEAAAMLRMGQERAELAADFRGAREAYRRASSQLRHIDDPRLNHARSLAARELEALEGIDEPDWTGLAGRLAQIRSGVADWPGIVPGPGRMESDPTDESEDTGWWSALKDTLGGLVRVRPRDELPLSPEQIEAGREQVRSTLLSAELALARRDPDGIAHHSGQARALVDRWFDIDAPAVSRAVEQLERLEGIEPVQLPALGEALAEVNRQLEQS